MEEIDDETPPKIKAPLLVPSLPFKPVLVNWYKRPTIAGKTLAPRKEEPGAKINTSLAKEEDNKVSLQERISQPVRPSGYRVREVAADSSGVVERDEIGDMFGQVRGREAVSETLTERTVKMVTDKIRQMDAR